MNNNQIYPFERNRYYAGKMLTSADFQAEQTYFNNKRRFLNSLMFGSGIACGLGVVSLDDLSILVESGAAFDGMGREIVVESAVVKKLSALEGFDRLKTDTAALCLRYQEKDAHTVYSVSHTDPDKEYEFNRISEGYELYLVDRDDLPQDFTMETDFITHGSLLRNSDFAVEFLMPATVSRGRGVKALLRIRKRSDADKALTYHGVLQIPAFLTPEGTHEIELAVDELFLKQGETAVYEYWMTTQDVAGSETNIILKSGTARAYENDEAVNVPANFTMTINLSDLPPRSIVTQEIGRMNLEMKGIGSQGDFIKLAVIKLMRTDSAYIIESVRETGIKHYVTAPAQADLQSEYMEYFVKEADITGSKVQVVKKDSEEGHSAYSGEIPEVATGTLEVPLGENSRKGDIFYSGEIMHGLGKGNVYVEVGYEYIKEDSSIGEASKSTIYGNPDLFANDQKIVVNVETAVRVLNDKGSFIVAARLLDNVDFLVLSFRWVALKFPASNDLGLLDDYTGKSISAETPTVVMGTKETHFFGVTYNNMPPCSITYELTESGSGEISSDGVYTAPAKEGVYEIRIYCTDMPVICTYAYAIVKKKGLEEENESE